MTDAPGLEERVAALEAALAFAVSSPPPRPLTQAEMAELQEALDEVAKQGPVTHFVIPSPPPLTPDQIRHLLRECVTVVKPGETLVIQERNWTPEQVREIQQWMDVEHADGRISFKVLVVIGGELAVAESEGSAAMARWQMTHDSFPQADP